VARKLTVVAALILILSVQRPHAQGSLARIYFVDIGTGAGTLIVSPTGKTLLVDGGPPGAGTTKIIPTLNTLGIATIDFTVLTHYHIDHDGGLTEVFNAGRVAGGIAYDNGDGAGVVPPSLSGSTGQAYTAYKNAVTAGGATRATIAPGQVIDLGGGMRATCLVAGGRLLSGGSVPITNQDLNSEAISLLVEYNNFDFIVSGDLTGGGSTSTEKSPDVETWVGQLAGDVDVAQLNHHGSTSASNQRFLDALKAEVAIAETGSTNTFGHPNRETVNKFLNTPATDGHSFAGTTVPPPGTGPVFYQIEQSSPSDDRESQQGYFGAPTSSPGNGTLLLQTDGVTTYSMMSFDDGGVRINPALHSYAIDAASTGLTTDFPPTVIPTTSPAAPLAADPVVVSAQVNDDQSPVSAVMLSFSLDGAPQPPMTMTLSGGLYVATIPAQPDGTRVDYTVSGTAGAQTTSYSSGYFSGTTPIGTLRVLNAKGEPLYAGYAARVRGLVTAGSGLFGAASNDDYIDDGTAAINVYRSTNGISAFTPTATGQTAEAVGHIESVGGRLRLDLTDSVEKTVSPWHTTILPNPLSTPMPLMRTIGDLNAAPELYEGRLVSVTGMSIVSGAIPASPAPLDAFVVVGDGTGSFVMKIDHDTDIEGFTPPSVFTLTGIVQQDDFLRPFDANYDVAPRSRVDLGAAAPAPPPLLTIGEARADLVNNADLNPTPDFIPDLVGKVVKVRGTVTSINFRPAGTEYYIQDATGGIDIFATATIFGAFGIGTTVEAVGSVTQFNGLTELQLTSLTPTGSATPPAAQLITLSQLADGGAGEAVEGRLIRVDGVSITGGSFPASGATGNVTITDATGSTLMRIDGDTNIDGTPTTAGTFSVVALASQFASTPPFDSGYQILPRSLSDIVVTGAAALAASPTALDFGSVAVAGSAIRSVTITNVGLSTITLNPPFAINGTGSSQYSATAPAVTTLAPGAATTVAVTFAPTTSGTKSASLNITSSGADSAVVGLTGLATAPGGGGGATGVVISEFRTRGPSGGNDEFVEIYNNSDAPIDISGWKMKGSNSSATTSTRATVPPGTTLPARRHYLFTNSGASGYSGSVPGNTTYGSGITDDGGVAITTAADVIVDQVGLSTGSAFKEGTVLAPMAGANQQAYERLPGGANGSTQDTGNNAADFVLRATLIDPQNLASLPTGAIKASPTSLDFGSVAAGGVASATVTITNTSATELPLTTPFLLTGTNPAEFVIGMPGASPLAGGASTTVSISFHPSAAGGKSATATIASPGGAPAVALTGVATPGISVTPSSVDFGSLAIGASATSSVTIANDDPTSPVTLSPPFQLTGANPGEFSVGIPGATTLAGGGSTSLVVGFVPTAAGGKSATLAIASAAGSVRTVSLTGSSACPAIAIGGSLPSGILLTPYSRSLIAGGGESPYTFSVSAGTIPAGLTLSASGVLSGTPTLASTFDFTVRVADSVGCLGTAAYSVPILAASIAIAPSPLDFNTVFLGSFGSAPVTITNSSPFPITLNTPLSVTGTDAAQFAVSAPVTTTLASGASTTAPVTFTPASIGAKSATLNVTSSAGGAASVALIGAGRFGPSVGSTILISELRFRGAGGAGGAGAASDEFVEIYNNSGSAVDISGHRLLASNSAGLNSTRATVPASTSLPPHGHYLFVNTAAQPGLLALANQTYGTGITDDGGVAFALPDGTTLLDQVGLSAGSAFKEGVNLTALTASLNQSYERKGGGAAGSAVDSNDNSGDFQLISPSDPQNLTSAPVPALFTAAPAPQDFGAVALGSARSATITITNTSTALVTLTPPFAITGTDAAQFSVGAPGASSLSGGSATTVGVVFTPASLGAKRARLIIASSDGGSAGVDLIGAAVCPAIAVLGPLAGGTFGVPYASAVTASGGAPPYTFIATGTLPAGLTLTSGGAIGGTPTLAGGYPFAVQATDANGCSGTADFSIAIAPASVSITWATPAPIVYGTPLGGSQLNATADAAGTFVYTPVAGTVVAAGAQPLHVAFTPADPVNYLSASADVTVDVTKRALTATADSTTREFGALNPMLTGSVTGVVNGDAITGVFTTTAIPASPEGTYPILAALLDPAGRLANYVVSLVNGTLRIVDTRPPVLTLPSTVSATATTPSGVAVTYVASAADPVDGPRPIVCAPASGTTFPIGATTVHCSATDSNGHTTDGTFLVTVTTATVPGRMVGDAEIESGTTRHQFEFVVQEHATGADAGALVYRVRTRTGGRDRTDTFIALMVANVSFYNVPGVSPGPVPPSGIDTVTFDGMGSWNGRSGYRYTAMAADAGEPGGTRDRFAITISDAAGDVVATVDAVITGGNIESLRLAR
jgi:beta-lactamase superfamily II metal-dependent hydrolase